MMMNFVMVIGQQGTTATPNAQDVAAATAAGIVGGLMFLAMGLVMMLVIYAVIAWLLSSCLSAVPEQFRQTSTGMVWVLMLPFVSLVGNFIILPGISDSFKAYFDSVGRMDVGDCGRQLGMITAILYVVSFAGSFVPVVNCFIPLVGIGGLVCFIIYIVKLFGLKAQIPAGSSEMPPMPN